MSKYLILFLAINTIISIVLAILLAKDAQKRGMNVAAWGGVTCVAGICSSLFGWIGMTLIYLLIRQPAEIDLEEEEHSSLPEQREPSNQPQYQESSDDVVFQRSEAPTAETSRSTLPVNAVPREPCSASILACEGGKQGCLPYFQQDSEIYDDEEDAENSEPLDSAGPRSKEPADELHTGEPDDTEIKLDDDTTAMLEIADEPAVFARLFAIIGPDKGKEFELPTEDGKGVLIGRKPPSDIIITDKTVSGAHAVIEVDSGEHRLSDQASKHGTFVYKGGRVEEDNKERVEESILLQNNDVIEMGKTRLVFVKVGTN